MGGGGEGAGSDARMRVRIIATRGRIDSRPLSPAPTSLLPGRILPHTQPPRTPLLLLPFGTSELHRLALAFLINTVLLHVNLEQRHDVELEDADAAEDAAEGDHDGTGTKHAEDKVLHSELDRRAAAAVGGDSLRVAGLRVVHPASAEDGPRGGEEADEISVPCNRLDEIRSEWEAIGNCRQSQRFFSD